MPPYATPTKRQQLTLAQISSYDDILTDALVDHVCSEAYPTDSPPRTKTNMIADLLLDHDP